MCAAVRCVWRTPSPALGLRAETAWRPLLWNQSEHLEAYFGVPSAGGVLHTLNLRLHPDEITFIANHAGDRFLIVDDVLLPVYEKFRDRVKFRARHCRAVRRRRDPGGLPWLRRACRAIKRGVSPTRSSTKTKRRRCVTPPARRGRSKGVVYSHRSVALHSMNCCGVDSLVFRCAIRSCQPRRCFTRMAGGFPLPRQLAGSKLVLPGRSRTARVSSI